MGQGGGGLKEEGRRRRKGEGGNFPTRQKISRYCSFKLSFVQFRAALLQKWDLPALLCNLCPFFQILSVCCSIKHHVNVLNIFCSGFCTIKPILDRPENKVFKHVRFYSILNSWAYSYCLNAVFVSITSYKFSEFADIYVDFIIPP